jgi:hydrogenase/urease accessory protein HupE
MKVIRPIPAAAALLASVAPLTALAHPGPHQSTSGLLHLLTEPDHLALLAGVVALGYWLIRRTQRRAVQRDRLKPSCEASKPRRS